MELDLSASMPGEWADNVDKSRPSELDGLTEIRVHGVSNTPPSAMLGDPHPRQVGGDNIAGFYRTSDGPSGRHREAYSWGGLTSGASSRALWILMLPAMLANMAGWMARETRSRTTGSNAGSNTDATASEADPGSTTDTDTTDGTTRVFQACARVAAIALTLTGATSTSYLMIDVLGIRWLPSGCGDAAGVCVLPDHAGSRAAIGALLAAGLALFVSWLGRRSRNRYEDAACKGPTHVSATGAEDPGRTRVAASAVAGGLHDRDFWATSPFHKQLSAAHLAVGLAVPATVLGMIVPALGPRSAYAGVVTGAGILALALALSLVVSGRGSPTRYRGTLALSAAALAGAVAAGFSLGFDDDTAPLRSAANTVSILWVSALALLLPLVLHQLGVARRWAHGDFFPWSAPVLLAFLAQVTLQTMLLAMIALAGTWLRTIPPANDGGAAGAGDLPSGTAALTPDAAAAAARSDLAPLVFTTVTVLVLVGLALLAALALGFVFGTWRVNARTPAGLQPAAVRADLTAAYAGRERSGVPGWAPPSGPDAPFWRSALRPGEESADWVAGVARFRRIARVSRMLARFLVVSSIVSFAILAVGTVLTLPGLRESAAGQVWAEQSVGPFRFLAWGVLALPPAALGLLGALWRNRDLRRVIGAMFDVGTCLPRSFHPFAPPSYSERAVPELGERINRLVANGGRVLLVAHSQGSVLSACVLTRAGLLSPPARDRVALVSYGSPLTTLYRWAFPSVFTQEVIDSVATGLRPPTDSGSASESPSTAPRWRNLYYLTDYIGGHVHLTGPGVDDDVNCELVDPPSRWYVRGEPAPSVSTHTGYANDDALWREVDDVARLLDAQQPPRG